MEDRSERRKSEDEGEPTFSRDATTREEKKSNDESEGGPSKPGSGLANRA